MHATRITLLDPALADQIAAGEVIERPASVVKELVDNAVDAGARRITIELDKGGLQAIRVVDTGHGMHPADLVLAVTRHATSKIQTSAQLLDIRTLGFRGEALASIAAVARLEIQSRRADDDAGTRLVAQVGATTETRLVGMPPGTDITVSNLFSSIPARRKFLRSEATEAAHCVEAVSRIALVHPEVHFRVRNNGRAVLDLAPCDQAARVAGVLERRGSGPYVEIEGEHDGTSVRAWLAGPDSATTRSGGTLVVVRGRVVHERNLQQIVAGAYGATLERGRKPVACLFVEPPEGSVDVNVHPQKVEVRFADAQGVYAAVRRVFERCASKLPGASVAPPFDAAPLDAAQRAAAVLERAEGSAWSAAPVEGPHAGGGTGVGYRLGTRALDHDYGSHKRAVAERAALLGRSRAQQGGAGVGPTGPTGPTGSSTLASNDTRPTPRPRLEFLTMLPPGVAVFRHDDELWGVDLRELRSHRVRSRLVQELAAGGVASQALLAPVSVSMGKRDAATLVAGRQALAELGLDLEAFGDDTVLVRGVPAVLQDCVDHSAVEGLLVRLVPWLRLVGPREDGVAALAGTIEVIPSARTATRWLEECIEGDEPPARIPGVRRFQARDLIGG